MILHALIMTSLLVSPPPSGPHATATGSLTVSAVVASSVSVTFNADGTYTMVVANAPADAETIAAASSESLGRHNVPEAARPKSKGGKHVSQH